MYSIATLDKYNVNCELNAMLNGTILNLLIY